VPPPAPKARKRTEAERYDFCFYLALKAGKRMEAAGYEFLKSLIYIRWLSIGSTRALIFENS
jgi:hypothetical protein